MLIWFLLYFCQSMGIIALQYKIEWFRKKMSLPSENRYGRIKFKGAWIRDYLLSTFQYVILIYESAVWRNQNRLFSMLTPSRIYWQALYPDALSFFCIDNDILSEYVRKFYHSPQIRELPCILRHTLLNSHLHSNLL